MCDKTSLLPLATVSESPEYTSTIPISPLEEVVRLHRLIFGHFYPTSRIPCPTAPWPEPPLVARTPVQPTTFHFFPFLPPTVCAKIWIYALPGPRVVEIHYVNQQHEFRSQPPVLLSVNRQSRAVTLTRYEHAAASPLNHVPSVLSHPCLAYVDFSADTFCPAVSFKSFITGEWKTCLKSLPHCEKVEKMGLPKRCFLFPKPSCVTLLLQYTSLKELVVLGDPCIDHHPRSAHKQNVRNDEEASCRSSHTDTERSIEEGWCLDDGEPVPNLDTIGEEGMYDGFERYVIAFMDNVREIMKEKRGRDMVMIYRRLCWGGQCWDPKQDEQSVVEIKRPVRVKTRFKGAVKKIKHMPREGVAKVWMLIT